uniref:General transcription and DNA repair factor IIH subunit TFB5 n=1 Tax=Oryza brachyantha TaxID=4533 RepID=J3MMA7_ORYBR
MLIRWHFIFQRAENMVNAIKGLFISCDVPMAQFIVNLNASMPASEKFILHMLDPTNMFVQPHVAEMIRSKISEFRDQNSYEKPA